MRVPAPSVAFALALSLAASLSTLDGVMATPTRPASKPSPIAQAVAHITAAGAFVAVDHLASPEYAGRLTGTGGYEAAAAWMAEECKRAGLQPAQSLKGYLQPFPVELGGIEKASLELLPADEKGAPEAQEFFKGYLPLLQSASGDVIAEVVFAGFGITASDLGRDDYARLKVEGKAVMILRGEPKDGRDWKAYDTTAAREANAKAHGAAAFLMVDQPVLSASGHPVEGMPAAMASEDLANQILSTQKLKVEEIRKVLEMGGTASFATGRKVHFAVKASARMAREGFNVVALLPGRDRKLDGDYVVVGAHLDHVGSWPSLFPGADDNASGSATLLEVARAMGGMKERPRRTVVFVWFGGEEMGLLGAKQFAQYPPGGLNRCVAVFNMDMVGVGTGAYVAGGKNFPEVFKALEEARDWCEPGIKLTAGESSGEARADHGPFQELGVHAVSLFGSGGSHHGYHTPEDTVFFITPKNMEVIGRIVFTAAYSLADSP